VQKLTGWTRDANVLIMSELVRGTTPWNLSIGDYVISEDIKELNCIYILFTYNSINFNYEIN